MADIKKLAPFILKWEGGFSNDPSDLGGATMKGITLKTYQAYRKEKGLPTPTVADLKNISDAEWTEIIKKNYWDKCRADEINSQPVANILVDWAFNSGPTTAVKAVQKIVGVSVNGVCGVKTITAINNYPNREQLFANILVARRNFYENIVKKNPSQGKFLKGWMNRVDDILKYSFK